MFHILLKNLSLLACERNLQDFSLSQKIGVIRQIHSVSHGFLPTKPKTCAIWVRKDSLSWVLFYLSLILILSIVYGHVLFLFLFLVVLFFRLFFILKKNPKTLKIFKKTQMFYFVSCFICFWGLHELWYLSLDLEHAWLCGKT